MLDFVAKQLARTVVVLQLVLEELRFGSRSVSRYSVFVVEVT